MPRVTSKGQVTIPKEIRDELGLQTGSQVEFVREDGRVVLRRRIPDEVFRKWRGYLRGKLLAPTVDETIELMRGERYRVRREQRDGEVDTPAEQAE